MKRSDELPKKFTAAEKRAYDWLYACNIRPWIVDLLTKTVLTPQCKYPSLVTFAKAKGMPAAVARKAKT